MATSASASYIYPKFDANRWSNLSTGGFTFGTLAVLAPDGLSVQYYLEK